jgi:hypothetical protein
MIMLELFYVFAGMEAWLCQVGLEGGLDFSYHHEG